VQQCIAVLVALEAEYMWVKDTPHIKFINRSSLTESKKIVLEYCTRTTSDISNEIRMADPYSKLFHVTNYLVHGLLNTGYKQRKERDINKYMK